MKIIEFTDRKAGWKRYVKAKSKSDAIAHVLASDYLINALVCERDRGFDWRGHQDRDG